MKLLTIGIFKIADRDIARTNMEQQRNNLIKDAMRERVVGRLAESWLQILVLDRVFDFFEGSPY